MKNLQQKQDAGFIALIATILISVVLLTVITGVAHLSFGLRFNILNSELKAKSTRLAEACVQTAILSIVQNNSYTGRETVFVNGNPCYICQVVTSGGDRIIYTQASSSDVFSNLEVQVHPSNGVITSWLERNSITISGGTCTIS